ncbi:cupin domain-containing protein [Bauldia litoralis]|uniref:Mannose-6-phosphate isomerase, cupin superfamily n=1 Tax=Bauldia litoralis TaxID=665467 RepID=A0A1G6DTU3_9HYPH|nr:cupin domain-containing protein [Bauldia litoralis]SDB48215.1 Mannose-6-phosphate isomerase, cupin superfamily [Bauldia litoralis]
MTHVIRPADQKRFENGTVAFEGRPYGGGVSIFLVDAAPGDGPVLHVHPYSETWVLHAGRARMLVDGKEILAEAGDIVVVPPDTPHRFISLGPARLEITCIHASDHFIQRDLEDADGNPV